MTTIHLDRPLCELLKVIYGAHGLLDDELKDRLGREIVESQIGTWEDAIKMAINMSAGARFSKNFGTLTDSDIKTWFGSVAKISNAGLGIISLPPLSHSSPWLSKAGKLLGRYSRSFHVHASTSPGSTTLVFVETEGSANFPVPNQFLSNTQVTLYTVPNPVGSHAGFDTPYFNAHISKLN